MVGPVSGFATDRVGQFVETPNIHQILHTIARNVFRRDREHDSDN